MDKINQLVVIVDNYSVSNHSGQLQTIFSTSTNNGTDKFYLVSGVGTIKTINNLHYSVGDKIVFCGYASLPISQEIMTCENNIVLIEDTYSPIYAYAGIYALLIHAFNMLNVSLGMVVLVDADADVYTVIKKIASFRGLTAYNMDEVPNDIIVDGAIVYNKKDSKVSDLCKSTASIVVIGEEECNIQYSQQLIKVVEPGVLSQNLTYSVNGATIPRHYIPYTLTENLATAISMIRQHVLTDSDYFNIQQDVSLESNADGIVHDAAYTTSKTKASIVSPELEGLFKSHITPLNITISIWNNDIDKAKIYALSIAHNIVNTKIRESSSIQNESSIIDILSYDDGSVINICVFKSRQKKLVIEGHFDSMSIKCEDGIAFIYDTGLKPHSIEYSINEAL